MSVLEEALLLSCELKTDELDCDKEFSFSASFEKKMNGLLDRMRGNKYHKFTKSAVRAMIIAAIVLSFSATVFAFPSARQYVIAQFSDHNTYKVSDADDKSFAEDIYIGYIPEGFTENSFSEGGGLSITAEYSKNDRWFFVQKSILDTKINYDAENEEIIKHNGIEYRYHSSGEAKGIIFNDGSYIFNVSGNISKDELKKIAFELK